jgi:hypothetical protein
VGVFVVASSAVDDDDVVVVSNADPFVVSNADPFVVSTTPITTPTEYVLGLAYQDLRGNQEAEVLVAPIRFDNATLPLSVSTPVSGTRLALETEVTVTIPEQALGGSVQVLFDPSFATYGGTDDSAGGQRVLVLVRVG